MNAVGKFEGEGSGACAEDEEKKTKKMKLIAPPPTIPKVTDLTLAGVSAEASRQPKSELRDKLADATDKLADSATT